MGCCSGALDFVGGTRRNTWGSALCGSMPIGLAALVVDTIWILGTGVCSAGITASAMGLSLDGWAAFLCTLPLLLPAFSSMVAALGFLHPEHRSVRLARASFYSFTFIVVLQLIMLPLISAAFLLFFQGHGYGMVINLVIAAAFNVLWVLPIRRSLYKILEAGGTGWEFQSAEELLVLSHVKGIEEGLEEPLIASNH